MDGNGWNGLKSLEIDGNGMEMDRNEGNGQTLLKTAEIAKNDCNWLEWFEIAENG